MTQSEIDFPALIQQFESWTREGKHQQILSSLLALTLKNVPRAFRPTLSEYATRIHQPILALRMMSPIVRPRFPTDEPPASNEKIIYATTLTSLGSLTEAEGILREIDFAANPDTYLHRAFICFRQWDYAAAIPLLKAYLRASNLDEYSRVIGKVNLIAAYIGDANWGETQDLIESVLDYTAKMHTTLLRGNTLELLAQVHLNKGEFNLCLAALSQAEEFLKASNTMYFFFVKKWQAITHCLMNPQSQGGLLRLNELRHEAWSKGYWEGLRDLDLYSAVVRRSQKDLVNVIRGTPYPQFHSRALRIWGDRLPDSIAGEFELLNFSPIQRSVVLDHRDMTTSAAREFDLSPLLLKAFETLIRDRYRPTPIGMLFHELFPQEFFDPFGGLKKINNIIHRLRQKFNEWQWPLELSVKKNEVILLPHASAGVRVKRFAQPAQREADFLAIARARFRGKTFTTAQFAAATARSQSFALRMIRTYVADGTLITRGRGPARRYLFSNHRDQAES